MAAEAKRINPEELRELLPSSFGSHTKSTYPWLKEGIEKAEKSVGAKILVTDKITIDEVESIKAQHIQHRRSPQGVSIVALPHDLFLEILEQGPYSLHGNLARVLVERGKEVPEEEDWIEAHRRTLDKVLKSKEEEAKSAAHEYLSHVLAGAAAYELLGGKTHVPDELRRYVEDYKGALKGWNKESLENLAKYYLRFIEAAKRLGFHTF